MDLYDKAPIEETQAKRRSEVNEARQEEDDRQTLQPTARSTVGSAWSSLRAIRRFCRYGERLVRRLRLEYSCFAAVAHGGG
jgi:hypothetical protein